MEKGCGVFNLWDKLYLKITGKLPPYYEACILHDEGYEKVVTKEDRKKEDIKFRQALKEKGTKIEEYVGYFLVRSFGWLAIMKRDFLRYFNKR